MNAEVKWSPDSKAFFLTYSDGGSVGSYHVKVVYVLEAGIRIVEPVKDGRPLFTPRCFGPEWPEIGGNQVVGRRLVATVNRSSIAKPLQLC